MATGRLRVSSGIFGPWTGDPDPPFDLALVVKLRPHTWQRVALSFKRVPQVGQIFVEGFDFSVVIGLVSRGFSPAFWHYTIIIFLQFAKKSSQSLRAVLFSCACSHLACISISRFVFGAAHTVILTRMPGWKA